MLSLLETTMNSRDLGGHTTESGKVTAKNVILRSDKQNYPSKNDIHFLLERNITTIIDMRGTTDVKNSPSGFETLEGFDYFNFPVDEGSSVPNSVAEVPQSYMDIASTKNMKQIFKTIANANSGVMYNCSAGKDRTGVVTAIILMLCDVKTDEIVKDYLLTKECCKERFKLFSQRCPEIDINIVIPQKSYISDFIALFKNQFVSAENYLLKIGLDEQEITKLKNKLLEE